MAKVWLARDADGQANLYSLLTAPPVRQANGLVTTQDETAECLAVFSAEQAETLFGVRLEPGECVCGHFKLHQKGPVSTTPEQAVSAPRRRPETVPSEGREGPR